MSNNTNTTNLLQTVKRLAGLYVENAKLTAAEKLTILISSVAFLSIILILSVLAMIFIAIGISNMLEAYLEPFWTFFIIAGLLVAVIVALVFLKDRIIVDPIARFITKLFIDSPEQTTQQDENK